MYKKILIICVLGVLFSSTLAVGMQTDDTEIKQVHRGSFQAEIGLRESNEKDFVLDGFFRDFRGRHILIGSISPDDTDRSLRFQGLNSRNIFIIQTGVRNNIVNVIGRFTEYDETTDEYSGNWIGFVAGVGRTSGWITAHFTS
jgi:hypothetical protein